MKRRRVGILCLVVTLVFAALVASAHARRPDSRLDRLERRFESLRVTVAALEEALGMEAPSVAPSGPPERPFVDERSRMSDSARNRVRQLQRRLVRLDGRISALEEAVTISSTSSAVQGRRIQDPRPLMQRRLEAKPLR